jgi:hypothetical protein
VIHGPDLDAHGRDATPRRGHGRDLAAHAARTAASGRVDAVHAWPGATILGSAIATPFVARTDIWLDIATYVQHLGG